ncbi:MULTISPECIES: hypothetical protein [unclassified Leucobacter]|uniref:hypothetical protein n=1 Tax=unclassified Leucobacter TaxID=2621730 RepID=UPI003015D709
MSDQNPNATGQNPQVSQPAQGAPHQAASSKQRAAKAEGLSTFLKVSIILLAALTIASISLLFIGELEGKFERVFSTFVLFAVFVLLTALDTRREQKSEWYAPVALIANAYILGLLLIVIWMTPYQAFGLVLEIFWKSVFVILVTRLVILCCQLLLGMSARLPDVVTRFAFVTSVLAVLSGILFTAPVGIEAFDLHIPDLYWKIATALLILTALGLSITLLLRWSFSSAARDAVRRARSAVPAAEAYRAQPQPTVIQQAPVAGAQPLLPWPTFPDGRPLPAGADGQPDFSVLQSPRG